MQYHAVIYLWAITVYKFYYGDKNRPSLSFPHGHALLQTQYFFTDYSVTHKVNFSHYWDNIFTSNQNDKTKKCFSLSSIPIDNTKPNITLRICLSPTW